MGLFTSKKDKEAQEIYEQGMTYLGTDDVNAFDILSKAAEMNSAPAQFELAKMYETGKGTTADRQAAAEWYSEAAEGGCDEAYLYLVKLYVQGLDPEFDEEETISILSMLMESGNDKAFVKAGDIVYDIGIALCNGTGSFKAPDVGLEILKKGSDLGIESCKDYLRIE